MYNLDKSLKNADKYYYRALIAGLAMLLFTIFYDYAFYPSDGLIREFNILFAIFIIGQFLLRKQIEVRYQLASTIAVLSIYGGYIFYLGGSNSDGAYLMLIGLSAAAIFLTLRTSLIILVLNMAIITFCLVTSQYHVNDVIDAIGMITVAITVIISANILKSNLRKTIEDLNDTNNQLIIEKNTVTKMASYHQLTQLANRNYFVELVNKTFDRHLFGSMIVFNIIDFHKINEVHGYQTGDVVLKSVADFLTSLSDDKSIIGYLGNNTYAIWFNQVLHKDEIDAYLTEQLSTYNEKYNVLLPLDVSTCVISADFSFNKSILDILKIAEKALKQMKKTNERFLYLDDHAYADIKAQDILSDYIISSIEDDNYINVFQEKYHTKEKKTYGLEVLTRLYLNDEFVRPDYFINLLEEKDKIIDFGIYTYKKVFQQMDRIKQHYGDDIVVSFNVSPKELVNPHYVKTIKSLIHEYQIDCKNIELEVTENVLIANLELLLPTFKALHDFGIQISLDDFGSGYSSLKYIVDLPIDTIKIDKSFMNDVEDNDIQKSVISSIIMIAKAKNISVVAEGIETQSQSDLLYDLGCYKVQGYYYSKPKPLDELIK